MSAGDVARHQKARLQGAMVEAVARHGYADTTLRELVALAGVSKSTFYDHFEDKEDCFLSTFDEIVKELARRVGEAYRRPGDFRERLLAALGVFLETTAGEPAAARLAAVDSLTLGAAGVEHRERASVAFENLIQQSFDHSPSERSMPATTVRAVVGGIRGVAYRRLRAGTQDELPSLAGELVDWALNYQRPDSEATARAVAAAAEPTPDFEGPRDSISWAEPPDSKLSRRRLSQRERILRGTASAVHQNGYAGLSIPAISSVAGVSNQTFYEHFASKRDAFLAAFQQISETALTVTAQAMAPRGNSPEAVGAGARALLEHVASSELFARLAFFELPTAGPAAMDRADEVLDSFTSLLGPLVSPDGTGATVSPALLEAIGSGIWAVIQYEIFHGRREQLPNLAPELARLATTPFAPGG